MWAQKFAFAIGVVLTVLIAAGMSSAAPAEDTDRAVEYLLDQVARSDCTFIRNGQSYDVQQAMAHLRSKYKYFKSQIQTPEDFIRLAATKSEITGKPYQIRTRDGRVFTSAEWLTGILAEYRSIQPASANPP
ncbi:MAG TPA: DUF5329 domain-containing protein [Candidatus Binatia bacterium]|jgi:hypothetical protein